MTRSKEMERANGVDCRKKNVVLQQRFCRTLGPTTGLLALLMTVSSSLNLYFSRRILLSVEHNHQPHRHHEQEKEGSATGPPLVRGTSIRNRVVIIDINNTTTGTSHGPSSPSTIADPDHAAHYNSNVIQQLSWLSSSGFTTPMGTMHSTARKEERYGDGANVMLSSNNSCVWGPTSSAACTTMLRQRLKLPLDRLLFFGDSTIHNLVREGGILEDALVQVPMQHCPHQQCQVRTTERCERTYGLPGAVPPAMWQKPNVKIGEGPISIGYVEPGCSDCSKCNSRFLDCTAADDNNNNNNATTTNLSPPPPESRRRCHFPHGGYVYMEFARDVVWQSARYMTTQENTAAMLRHSGRRRSGLLYPNTVCVMAAGLHDMDVIVSAASNNVSMYLQNVRWLLSLYLDDDYDDDNHSKVCEHVVWLANASPASDNYTQTIARTKEWNELVQYELTSSSTTTSTMSARRRLLFQHSTTYIDLWAASQSWRHADNLHMDNSWNWHLSQLFVPFLPKPSSSHVVPTGPSTASSTTTSALPRYVGMSHHVPRKVVTRLSSKPNGEESTHQETSIHLQFA